MAALRSHRKIVELLIESAHCCDDKGWTVLHHASCLGWVEVVQSLVNKGVALNKKNHGGETPLMVAVQESHVEVAELLINLGADIHCSDDMEETVLHHASSVGSVEIVRCLVNKGVDLDKKNCVGEPPLMEAIVRWHLEVVELLLNSGADVYCEALHQASFQGADQIVQWLVKKGAALDIKDFLHGKTPLMYAAERINLDVFELLVNSGADIHCCDNSGWTALHYVSHENAAELIADIESYSCTSSERKDRGKIAECLMKTGADCNLENNLGESPFNFLISDKEPHFEMIALCIEIGAYVKSTDYNKLLEEKLKSFILQDVKFCSQLVINKFNNRELPLLYKGLSPAQKFPPIDKMMTKYGSGMAFKVIEQSVTHDIKTKGFCNLSDMKPLILGMLSVKSAIEKFIPAFDQE